MTKAWVRQMMGASPKARPTNCDSIDTQGVHVNAVILVLMDDFPKAALKHLQDGQTLLKSNRFDGAAYLAGYVVECALKTMIDVENKEVPHIHDLSELQSRLLGTLAEASWRGLDSAPITTPNRMGPVTTCGH